MKLKELLYLTPLRVLDLLLFFACHRRLLSTFVSESRVIDWHIFSGRPWLEPVQTKSLMF